VRPTGVLLRSESARGKAEMRDGARWSWAKRITKIEANHGKLTKFLSYIIPSPPLLHPRSNLHPRTDKTLAVYTPKGSERRDVWRPKEYVGFGWASFGVRTRGLDSDGVSCFQVGSVSSLIRAR
jgi:hypothetical protein